MRHCPVLLLLCGLLAGCQSRPLFDRLPSPGTAVPAFNLPTLAGDRVSPAQLVGSPVVLALWSTTCSASRLALQGLEAVQRDYASRGVRVLVVADDSDAERLRAFVDSAGVSLPVAYASGELHDLFDPKRRLWQKSFGLPSWLVLDAQGRVAERTIGVPLAEADAGQVRLGNVRDAIDRVLGQHQAQSSGSRSHPAPAAQPANAGDDPAL
jgi:peroxiredoxin